MKENDPLRLALRSLPRVPTGKTFTESVMGRVEAEVLQPGLIRFWPAGVGALLFSAVLAAGFLMSRSSQEIHTAGASTGVRAQLQALKADQMKLQREWQELRQVQRERAPVLRLGGNEQVDLVLDLCDLPPGAVQFASQAASRPSSRARPHPSHQNPVRPQGRRADRAHRRPRR